MDESQEKSSSPASRRRWNIWFETLSALGGLVAASLASFLTLGDLTTGFASMVLGGFALVVALQTFLATRPFKRSTPAQELKENVRKAYTEALGQLSTKALGRIQT